MKLEIATQMFLFDKEAAGASSNTIATYTYDLKRFTRFCATLDITEIQDITTDTIRRFLYHLRTETTLSPKTIKNNWVVLSSLWTWAADELHIPHVVRKTTCPAAPPPDITPLTTDEIKLLLKASQHARAYHTQRRYPAERARPTSLRDQAIILILLDTGIRATELCNLTRDDCNLRRGTLHIRDSKSRLATKSRHVPFGVGARKALFHYLAFRRSQLKLDELPGADPLFASNNHETFLDRHALRRLLRRTGERAGVPNVHPHRFRHTFAILYLRNGGDALTLQRILGHNSLDMVKTYIKLAREDIELTHKRASPVDNAHLRPFT